MLTDVTAVLLHPKLLEELFLPQPVATHIVIKQLLQDISTTSIMKLDDYSMSKLWDLMTIIFKWQLAVATNQNIFDITYRHITSVATLMPQYFPKCIFEQTMKKFENLSNRFTDDDYKSLNNTLILWFSEYHSKISVLLRLGLQRKDGTFMLPSSIDPKIIANLGENIYKYDNKKKAVDDYENKYTDTVEINCLLAQINTTSTNIEKEYVILHLPIDFGSPNLQKRQLKISKDPHFENIDINIKNKTTDLSFIPDKPTSPHEDLLAMMETNDVNT